jgi:fused signal recognition particle receptor
MLFKGLFKKVTQLFTGRTRLDESLYDELEETLIQSDVGFETSMKLVETLRTRVRKDRLGTAEQAKDALTEEIATILASGNGALNWAADAPTLILVIGVNGTGKTTSVAKMAQYFQERGNRVLLAAADTFRAAAIDQLQVWADRLQIDLVRHREGADPAAVVFDAVQAARARGADLVIADTAGRLHTKANLMEELKKIDRVAQRALGRPPDEVLLVLDATIGQNAVSQARTFAQAMPISGVVLTKMDGTARGGVVISIRDELQIPIKFVGTGEKASDFAAFDPREFADAMFQE